VQLTVPATLGADESLAPRADVCNVLLHTSTNAIITQRGQRKIDDEYHGQASSGLAVGYLAQSA